MNLHSSNALTSIFSFITHLGEVGFIWISLCLILMISRRTRKIGFVMIVALGINYFVVDIALKHLIERVRPFYESEIIMDFLNSINYKLPSSYSFPSGHSSSAFTVAFTLFLYNKNWGTPSVILASLIAYSRMYLGVHYLSDVLAGVMIGIIIACVIFNFVQTIEKKLAKKQGITIGKSLLYTDSICYTYTKNIKH